MLGTVVRNRIVTERLRRATTHHALHDVLLYAQEERGLGVDTELNTPGVVSEFCERNSSKNWQNPLIFRSKVMKNTICLLGSCQMAGVLTDSIS